MYSARGSESIHFLGELEPEFLQFLVGISVLLRFVFAVRDVACKACCSRVISFKASAGVECAVFDAASWVVASRN